MFGLNPRHRRRHHRRHHRGHRRHRHSFHGWYSNPRGGQRVGVMSMIQNPMETVGNGLTGAVGLFLPIAIPNWLLPFPGTDIMSKAIRFASRAATAGLLLQFGGRFLGRYQGAFKTGAYIGVAGSTVLDFMGTNVVLGYGDTTQTPGRLLAGFGTTTAAAPAGGVAGMGAAYQRMRGMGAAYSRLGLRGLHGANSLGTGFRHGLTGGY